MTPLGLHLRHMRAQKNITQKEMAAAIGVSPAYLSALEHGRRGRPSWVMLQRILGYFNVIWDDAEMLEKLAAISDPKVVIDTVDLSPRATHAANLLANQIALMNEGQLEELLQFLLKVSNGDP